MVYLTSDGFVDQQNNEEKKFGSKKMEELLKSFRNLGMKEQKERLLQELRKHRGEEEQRDDILILGVQI